MAFWSGECHNPTLFFVPRRPEGARGPADYMLLFSLCMLKAVLMSAAVTEGSPDGLLVGGVS